MLAVSVYKNIHLLGVFMVLMALGGVILHHILGGARQHAWRKPVAITHGIGLLLVLLGALACWLALVSTGPGLVGCLSSSYLGGLWRLERCRGPQYDIGATPVVGHHYSGRVGRLSRYP